MPVLDNKSINATWNFLKNKSSDLIENDLFLNKKIKEYLKQKKPDDFQKDFGDLLKYKGITSVNFEKDDPQNLIKIPFMRQKNLYIEIPKDLKK